MPETDEVTSDEVTHFIERGFVRIDDAFPSALAEQCRAKLWAKIKLSPGRPQEWTLPVIRVPYMTTKPFVAAANTQRLQRA